MKKVNQSVRRILITIIIIISIITLFVLFFKSEKPRDKDILNLLNEVAEVGAERDESRINSINTAWWHGTCLATSNIKDDIFLFGSKEKRLVAVGAIRSWKENNKWIINHIGLEEIEITIISSPECLPNEYILDK